MTVGPLEYAGDMPATEAQVDSIKEDIRALSDTVSEILVTVKDHGHRLDKVENRLDGMDSAIQEILTLVRRGP